MNLENRRRWDFRTGLYYTLVKRDEAPQIGLLLPDGVDHVRLYSDCSLIHFRPLRVENPRSMYKLTGIE